MKQELFNALVNKDKSYVGKYYAGVISTGIFCQMDCPCKKPLYDNVVFYKSIKECLEKGLRSCKVCLSIAHKFSNIGNAHIREYIKKLEINEFPDKSYKKHSIDSLDDLISIKKEFQKAIGLSLGKYIRIKRIHYILKNDISSKNNKNKIFFNYISSPIGEIIFCYFEDKLTLLEFVDRKMLETELNFLKDKLKGFFVYKKSKFSDKISKQINEYFNNTRTSFSIKLNTFGTEFQKNVWNELTKIPYGKTISYKEQATNINKPLAVRAVASANGKNMIGIIIPCHRVIASNGKMAGYGGGIERKKYLIDLEVNNKTS